MQQYASMHSMGRGIALCGRHRHDDFGRRYDTHASSAAPIAPQIATDPSQRVRLEYICRCTTSTASIRPSIAAAAPYLPLNTLATLLAASGWPVIVSAKMSAT